MARPQSPPILAQLRSARTVSEQTAALRALKNDIVGHVQKKEEWIALGVLDPIARTISTGRPQAKLNGKGSQNQFYSRQLSEDDGARLQALQLVASFAHGMIPLVPLTGILRANVVLQVVLPFWHRYMPPESFPPSWPASLRTQTLTRSLLLHCGP